MNGNGWIFQTGKMTERRPPKCPERGTFWGGKGGGRREGKDLEEKRSCESYVNITASGISRKEFMVSMKFSSDDPKSAQSILRRYKNKNTETLIHRLAKIREDT